MPYELKRQDREVVLEALQRGEYEAIATSGQGALDALVHLAIEVGVFEALSVITITREREGVPDALLLRTLAILPFVEGIGLSAAAGRLFEDAAILLQLGYTIEQVQEGFNDRHHAGEEKATTSTPCHPEVLRQELARIDVESLDAFRKAAVQQLFARKLVRGKVCAIDGSGLKDRSRLVGVLTVQADQALWLTWRVLKGGASEKGKEASVVRSMIEEIREVGGAEAIEWLLMDALYADGPLLAWLEYECGIHALVRLPEDRLLMADLQGLARGGLLEWSTHTDLRYVAGQKHVREVSVAMDENLTSWDSFLTAAEAYHVENPTLWGALIHAIDVEDQSAVEDWGLVSTHPFPSAWAGYCQWRKRWRIENTGFRELKEGWHLERAPWSYTNDIVVASRVALTLVAFNVAQIAKTVQGRQLTDRGIRRLRRELAREYGPAPVIVFTKDAYGVFHIEEVMAALGVRPTASLRRQPGSRRSPPQAPS